MKLMKRITRRVMTTKKKDYEKIISIQETIINKKENEFKALEKCFFRVMDTNDNNHQWSFWYRAWSEYLEKIIQQYLKTKDPKTFDVYWKILKNPVTRVRDGVENNPFMEGGINANPNAKDC